MSKTGINYRRNLKVLDTTCIQKSTGAIGILYLPYAPNLIEWFRWYMGELSERSGGYIIHQGDASSRNTGSGDCGFRRSRYWRPVRKDGFPASGFKVQKNFLLRNRSPQSLITSENSNGYSFTFSLSRSRSDGDNVSDLRVIEGNEVKWATLLIILHVF